jgi:HAD superfamily hydrolase (TIGR01484 family)
MNAALSRYDSELAQFRATYESALTRNVSHLKAAIAGASELSIIGVGSGGSFMVASLLCNLHEAYTGRVSRAATPLEIMCNPTLASSSPVFLISAEGNNPDITEALQRARLHSARPIHVLTNRQVSSLMQRVDQLTDVTKHVFELSDKDGYLATNSMLLDAVLIARAYCELDGSAHLIPTEIDRLSVNGQPVREWVQAADAFVREAVRRRGLIITYSPWLRPIAADLESKLSEAALLYCQLADLRSFAHGRHLWLAERADDCAVLVLTEPSVGKLWERMQALFPPGVPALAMPLAGASPHDMIGGLVAGMHLVAAIAHVEGRDPGKPIVPDFGRSLYYLDLPEIIPKPPETVSPVSSKYEVLGAQWPSANRNGAMQRAMDAFRADIEERQFRAIVFDYDGTLCSSQRNDQPPPEIVLEHVRRLLRAEIIVAIASGRGGSIQEFLSSRLEADLLAKIQLGLYNGGWISAAATPPSQSQETSEFLSHVTRIAVRLKRLGVPIDNIRTTHPYQVSIRFREGLSTEHMWFVVADALRQAGLELSSMVRSKHSIDVLAAGIGKARLLAHIIQTFAIDPYDILTIGDQGAWPGNDATLLEHRYSLSVDAPSRRLDRGWKLAPAHKRDVDATLWYLERIHTLGTKRLVTRFSTL